MNYLAFFRGHFLTIFFRYLFLFWIILFPTFVSANDCTKMVGYGTRYEDLSNIPSGFFVPGAVICINPGNYTDILVLAHVAGSQSGMIEIRSTDDAHLSHLVGGILLRDAAYIDVGFLIASAPDNISPAAILLDEGSHHNIIQHTTAQYSQNGIQIGSIKDIDGYGGSAGGSNIIFSNITRSNTRAGIYVAHNSGGGPTGSTEIRKNTVIKNGGHGIDLDTVSHVIVEGNHVIKNGSSGGGHSGIHVYQKEDIPGQCEKNSILSNRVSATYDRLAYDGNGIQVDHFCDENIIRSNTVFGNDGRGISLFTTRDNIVESNTLFSNERIHRKFATSYANPYGEIVVSTCLSSRDCLGGPLPSRTTGNRITHNRIRIADEYVPGVHLYDVMNQYDNTSSQNIYVNPRGFFVFAQGGIGSFSNLY